MFVQDSTNLKDKQKERKRLKLLIAEKTHSVFFFWAGTGMSPVHVAVFYSV